MMVDISQLVTQFNEGLAPGAKAEVLTDASGDERVQIGDPSVCQAVVSPHNPVLTPSDFVLLACRRASRPGHHLSDDLQGLLAQIEAPTQGLHWLHVFELRAFCGQPDTQDHLITILAQLRKDQLATFMTPITNTTAGLLQHAARLVDPQVLRSLLDYFQLQTLPELSADCGDDDAALSAKIGSKTILKELLAVIPAWLKASKGRAKVSEQSARDEVARWVVGMYEDPLFKSLVGPCFRSIKRESYPCGLSAESLKSPKKAYKGVSMGHSALGSTIPGGLDVTMQGGGGRAANSLFTAVDEPGPRADSERPGLRGVLTPPVDGGHAETTPLLDAGETAVQAGDEDGGKDDQPQGCCTIL